MPPPAAAPYPDTWYQGQQGQQFVQQMAQLDQQAVAKLGPVVDTPMGRRNSLIAGQVLRFNYTFHEPGHDPQPLVLVAFDAYQDGLLHGINLHYLTMKKARSLLYYNCGNVGFKYGNIAGDAYIKDAYRTYRWNGVQLVKYEDCQFLNKLLSLQGLLTVQQLSAMIARIRQMAAEQPAQAAVPTQEQAYTGVGTPTTPAATPAAPQGAAPAVPVTPSVPVVGQPQPQQQ